MSNTEAKNPRTIGRALLAISTPNGFRSSLGWFIVVGLVVALTGPAAGAADGDPVILGGTNSASNTTYVSSSSGAALEGYSDNPSPYAAVVGYNVGGGDGVEGTSANSNGVYGNTASSFASGVYGVNDLGGFGVAGRATSGGVAVLADAADGTGVALRTTGKLEFQNRSGIVSVASGQKSITVTLAGVTATSMVMATVQQTGGFYVKAAVPAAGSFKIYINKAPVSPETVKVAYLVLN